MLENSLPRHLAFKTTRHQLIITRFLSGQLAADYKNILCAFVCIFCYFFDCTGVNCLVGEPFWSSSVKLIIQTKTYVLLYFKLNCNHFAYFYFTQYNIQLQWISNFEITMQDAFKQTICWSNIHVIPQNPFTCRFHNLLIF